MTFDWLTAYLFDQTVWVIMAGTGLLGLTAGAFGAFALLRNQGMLGDAIAHAALPGTVIAFLITHSKSAVCLCGGGVLSALLGICLVECIAGSGFLKRDVAIGVILSVFFGIGLVLLTIVQKYPMQGQALLHRLLFGNAAMMTIDDVWVIAVVALILLSVLLLFWKDFLIVLFDAAYARTLGYAVFKVNGLLMIAIIAIVAIGLQTTGGVLMSTLLLAPAAAARQWTHNFLPFIVLSSLFGASCAMVGSLASTLIDHLPTGPAIVLVVGVLLVCSLVVGKYGVYA